MRPGAPESADSHARYRDLISAAMESPLPADEAGDLDAHLLSCARCRAVQRAYRQQRRLLATLPRISPPRDMWARTAAALDREVARSPETRAAEAARAARRRPARMQGSPMLALTAMGSLALAAIVVVTQAGRDTTASPSAAAAVGVEPTPFSVATQNLVLTDFTAQGVSIYQTQVSQVCPQPAIDCTSASVTGGPVFQIQGNGTPRGIAVHAENGRLALIAGDDSGYDTVSVVMLPPYGEPASGSSDDVVPARTPALPTPDVAGTPSATPAQIGSTGSGGASETSAPSAPRPTAPVTSPRRTTRPVQRPGSTRPSHPPTPPASRTPAPPATPATVSTPATRPPANIQPTARPAQASNGGALAIIANVRVVGAPPAWSADGEMLAFSATPADQHAGPDIYVWQPGEPNAERVTNDHQSYFASWDGALIVMSQVTGRKEGAASIDTTVLDPATGRERRAFSGNMWLPAVDPSGRRAVAWVGSLDISGTRVTPRSGALFVVDWRSIDPFADGASAPATAPSGTRHAPSDASTAPVAASRSQLGSAPGPRRNVPKPKRLRSIPPATTPAASTPAAHQDPDGAILGPVEPDRNVASDPVLEWQVRWSDDGKALGFWVADGSGSNWGELTVLHVLPAGTFDTSTLLGPTLARSAFSLGEDRVAWVAPSDDTPKGELRIRTWDRHGYGGLRIRDIQVQGGVPAF